ncbi:DNA-binding protein [Actinomyces viscosus]|uniref:DNA binding domain, excisionase family n=1 Tax=Actinomyces viscosus TaxID=1656 RepID=A0A3S4WHU6_ACTVI|nr:helix-turn-helix domain-containing protein [Actinomyces viscosus]TFH53639.1 DNA-binding protein [Actinomyces viscosus]VEI14320.1 DNA binding domain, excisionase family [Actinomyces viscosus]
MTATTLARTTEQITIPSQTAHDARVASAQHEATIVLRTAGGHDTPLPSSLQDIIFRALQIIGEGGSVSIGQIPEELTSTAAADLLGVSRPTLLRWSREGKINSFKVGTHTRFHLSDVMKLHNQRESERRKAFEELRALDAEDDFKFFNN